MAIDQRIHNLINPNYKSFDFPEDLVRLRRCVNYSKSGLKVQFPVTTKLFNLGHAFNRYNSNGSEELIVSEGINSLNDEDFEDNTALKRLTLPSTLRDLNGGCFRNCVNLEEIIINNGLKRINSDCFDIYYSQLYDQDKLTYIELPSSIEYIYPYAFSHRNKLEVIRIHKRINSVSGAPWGAVNASIIWDCGTVNINITEGSTLFIDNQQVNTNPYYVDEGIHTWKCYNKDYPMKSGSFEIAIDEIYNLNVDMTDGVGYTVTCKSTQEFEDEIVEYKYDNYILINKSIVVAPNTTLTVKLKKAGYKTITNNITITEDTNLVYEMEEAVSEIIHYTYPFDMSYDNASLNNFIDNYNFRLNGQYIESYTASYHVNSGYSYGYIKFKTPDYDSVLKVKCYTSSESKYDFGAVYYGTSQYQATNYQIRNAVTDGNGNWLYRSLSNNPTATTPIEYSTALTPNTEYYLQFYYAKDESVNNEADKFYISDIEFEAAPM